ncbi:hypothetical protein NON00_06905 [Roseomonas sp. GC11]|uniref:hypothetical protein n=1 Tax=Roseomonas sp. GC11 TaxID=2950546 RepID=UPI00210C1F58|nr:hypothetical protein [Roseomonas sp. GC11]MCQ4159652.1 hypothetical protein [Roseomonas sp. GC11]
MWRSIVTAAMLAAPLMALPGGAVAQPVSFTPFDQPAQEAVQAARSWQFERAQKAGVTPRVATARIDLDGDGVAEIVAVVQAPDRCAALGLRNCPLVVLHRRSERGRFQEVGSFFGDAVQILDSSNKGWRDIETRFTQGPWRRTEWNGLLYQIRR